jgi:hypothetical protein
MHMRKLQVQCNMRAILQTHTLLLTRKELDHVAFVRVLVAGEVILLAFEICTSQAQYNIPLTGVHLCMKPQKHFFEKLTVRGEVTCSTEHTPAAHGHSACILYQWHS